MYVIHIESEAVRTHLPFSSPSSPAKATREPVVSDGAATDGGTSNNLSFFVTMQNGAFPLSPPTRVEQAM